MSLGSLTTNKLNLNMEGAGCMELDDMNGPVCARVWLVTLPA